jgi:hypothetical protein
MNEKVYANTRTNNKGKKIFYTLFAQHVSNLTWDLFRCSFTTELSQQQQKTQSKINQDLIIRLRNSQRQRCSRLERLYSRQK